MASIEIAQLSAYLDEASVAAVTRAIRGESSDDVDLESNEDHQVIDGNIDDDLFVDFRDRLEANELDADIYVPVDFEEVLTVSDYRIGSTIALQSVLESLREDFFIEDQDDSELVPNDDEEEDFEDEEEEDEDEDDDPFLDDEDDAIEMKDAQLRHIWRLMNQAAHDSVANNLVIFIRD